MLPDHFVKNNPDSLVPAHVFILIEYIFGFGLTLIFTLIGLCTNTLNIRVFLKQDFQKYPVNVTLLALAVTDLSAEVFAILYRIPYILELFYENDDFEDLFYNLVVYFGGAQIVTARIGYSMAALLSVERWVSVTFPLSAKRLLTFKYVVFLTLSVVVLNILLIIPAAVIVDTSKTFNPQSNQSDYLVRVILTNSGSDNDDVSAKYLLITAIIVIPSICTWTVVVCTISITLSLKKAKLWRRSTDFSVTRVDSSAREARLERALLTIMILFIVCELPMTLWGYQQLWASDTYHHNLQILLLVLVATIETINSSMNFFVYITFYPSFKETFKKLYPCFWQFKCRSMHSNSCCCCCCTCKLILSCRCCFRCCVKSQNSQVALQCISSPQDTIKNSSNDSVKLQRAEKNATL